MNSTSAPSELSAYRVQIRLPVQWGDQDAFGHVNNTVYFRWFESARIAYFEQSGMEALLRPVGIAPILASIKCNYLRQITYPDFVIVGAKIGRIGNSSMAMTHALYSERLGAIAAEGDSVVVAFDYAKNISMRVPDDARALVEQFENK